jgi:bacterial/archaeal transporter family protein
MAGILFALFSSLLFAISSLALKKGSTLPSSISFFFDMILGVIIFIPSALILGVHANTIVQALPYAFLSALISEALYFFVISKGKLAITGTIISSSPIYTMAFAWMFLGEHLTFIQLFSVIVVIIGSIIVAIPENHEAITDILKDLSAVLWPLVGALAIGASDVTSKYILDATTDFSFLFALACMQIPISLIFLKTQHVPISTIIKEWKKSVRVYHLAFYGALFNVIGVVFYWMSFHTTFASIASPLVSTYGGITVIFALLFLKEKITKIQVIGIVLLTTGVMLLSLTTI